MIQTSAIAAAAYGVRLKDIESQLSLSNSSLEALKKKSKEPTIHDIVSKNGLDVVVQSLKKVSLPMLSGFFMHLRSYLENTWLDNKNNLIRGDERVLMLMNALMEVDANKLFVNNTELTARHKDETLRRLNELTLHVRESVTIGQLRDEHLIRVIPKRFNNPLMNLWAFVVDEEPIIKYKPISDYLAYTRKISGSHYSTVAAMGAIANPDIPEDEVQILKNWGRYLGMMAQMLNDMQDFLPLNELDLARGKSEVDAFADLQKGKLTLPVYDLLKGLSRDAMIDLCDDVESLKAYAQLVKEESPSSRKMVEAKSKAQVAAKNIRALAKKTGALQRTSDLIQGISKWAQENIAAEWYEGRRATPKLKEKQALLIRITDKDIRTNRILNAALRAGMIAEKPNDELYDLIDEDSAHILIMPDKKFLPKESWRKEIP